MLVNEDQGRYLLERLRRVGEMTATQVHELLTGSQVETKYNNPNGYVTVRDVEMFLENVRRKGLIELSPAKRRGQPSKWRATNALNLHLLKAEAAPRRVSIG